MMNPTTDDSSEFFVEPPGQRAPQPTSKTPAIVGFLIGGAIILALGFVGHAFDDRDEGDGVPTLRVMSPASGDSLRNPVVLRFSTDADLGLGRYGWSAGDLHLHAMTDHTEIMPAAADITADSPGFVWRLPHLEPGERRVYLTWAGRNHANLRGRTDTLHLHILP
ncbi:hypothetical protein BH23GEM9_BH23GEM9_27200 [soil metagenome]